MVSVWGFTLSISLGRHRPAPNLKPLRKETMSANSDDFRSFMKRTSENWDNALRINAEADATEQREQQEFLSSCRELLSNVLTPIFQVAAEYSSEALKVEPEKSSNNPHARGLFFLVRRTPQESAPYFLRFLCDWQRKRIIVEIEDAKNNTKKEVVALKPEELTAAEAEKQIESLLSSI
jgi:hypothetical protein